MTTVRSAPPRERDRVAMRRVIAERGFEHAIDSITTAVAVAVVPGSPSATVDQRMGEFAELAEAAVLNALVHLARRHGWAGGS